MPAYNAGVLGLSVKYQRLAEYFYHRKFDFDRSYVLQYYPEIIPEFDRDYQGGESVFMDSLRAASFSSSSAPLISSSPLSHAPPLSHPPTSHTITSYVSAFFLGVPYLLMLIQMQMFVLRILRVILYAKPFLLRL